MDALDPPNGGGADPALFWNDLGTLGESGDGGEGGLDALNWWVHVNLRLLRACSVFYEPGQQAMLGGILRLHSDGGDYLPEDTIITFVSENLSTPLGTRLQCGSVVAPGL